MSFPRWFLSCIARVEAGTSGYLDQVGWIQTRSGRAARDKAGDPIPWFTYPAIALLSERLQPGWRVLEFGAGMGTIWWSKRVDEVVAVEHDPTWANRISKQCHAKLHHVSADSPEAYIAPLTTTEKYDVVIVDGLFRCECLAIAPKLITENGVIILDDAQRAEYRPAIGELLSAGFKILEFHGPQPVSKHPGCTAVLYRGANVLDI